MTRNTGTRTSIAFMRAPRNGDSGMRSGTGVQRPALPCPSQSFCQAGTTTFLRAYPQHHSDGINGVNGVNCVNGVNGVNNAAILQTKYDLQVVLVDHYDSYTYNLYDMIASLCTRPPLVLTKDFLPCDLDNSQTDQLLQFPPCDAIILSPGPGRPSCPQDMGYTLDWIRHATQRQLPLLGVCLGHQALAHVHGATVRECQTPVHGQVHPIQLISSSDSILWEGISGKSIPVTRYHSLGVYDIPDVLTVTAHYTDPMTGECVIMALQHKTLPQYGVQFHPESIGTPHGRTMMDNFLKSCVRTDTDTRRAGMIRPPQIIQAHIQATVDAAPPSPPLQVYRVSTRTLTGIGISTSRVFEALYHQNASLAAIWLDSSLQQQQQSNSTDDTMTRYSILAGMTGPLSRRIDYYGQEHADCQTRGVYVTHSDGKRERDESVDNILDYLERNHKGVELIYDNGDTVDLPFVGGHLGYLGYEVRHDTQRKLDHLELDDLPPTRSNTPPSTTGPSTNAHVPTAAFLFCDQCLVYDHWNDSWHLIELTTPTSPPTNWMLRTEQVLRSLSATMTTTTEPEEPPQPPLPTPLVPLLFVPNRSRSAYQADIANCHEQIRLGESYELCLTNQLEAVVPSSTFDETMTTLDPYQLYKILRNRNPAPFAAYVNFQGTATTATTTTEGPSGKLSICCSSPERFVSVRPSSDTPNDFIVEAKPIKGTAPRYQSTTNNSSSGTTNHDKDTAVALGLQTSIKNRAENLMIVDLLRNDLNRVCQTGTVHVPKLMAIETYATVHQLVSTIRGVLESDKTALDVLTACFPGGSMTGAPKRRTVELLDEMEDGVSRGPYAGCLGYLSLNGRMDMNIVIRSIVVTPSTGGSHDDDGDGWKVSIGAGGAITALSESDDEYEEMLLKARAVKEAVEIWASSVTGTDSYNSNQATTVVNAESLLELNVEVPK